MLGVVVTAVVASLGFIASITSFLLAGGAAFLYAKGAGTAPRKGVVPLMALIVVGLIVSFQSIIAVDAWGYASSENLGVSPLAFTIEMLLTPQVYAEYAKEGLMFVVFAVPGVFSVFRQLAGKH